MADRKLFCKDCTQQFIFSEGEQRFFADKGITEDPVRCPACRLKKRSALQG